MTAPAAPRALSAAPLALLCAAALVGLATPLLPWDAAGAVRLGLSHVRGEWWAPLAAVAAFAALAGVSVPHIVLTTALVYVFGPWPGFAYSYAGNLVACALGFAVGRVFGRDVVRRHATPQLAAFMARVGRRGVLFSAGIRLLPTVPSVIVNIAAGSTPLRFGRFIVGTALGSAPKMAVMALGGHAAMTAFREKSLWAWAALAAVGLLWLALGLLGRRLMRAEGPDR